MLERAQRGFDHWRAGGKRSRLMGFHKKKTNFDLPTAGKREKSKKKSSQKMDREGLKWGWGTFMVTLTQRPHRAWGKENRSMRQSQEK